MDCENCWECPNSVECNNEEDRLKVYQSYKLNKPVWSPNFGHERCRYRIDMAHVTWGTNVPSCPELNYII